ncbi:MAG: hypothetical protein CVU74_03010, partial [Deltaproteobacteria bacterium HGW-Deltaproteobacteria-9]
PLMAAKALDVSATYYEEKTLRDKRVDNVQYPVAADVIAAIRDCCLEEGRIPLTDEALNIAAAAGIKSVAGATVKSAGEEKDISLKLPFAVKLLSRNASHKSDIGGVRLKIVNHEALVATIADMTRHFENITPRPSIDGFLVQEMAAEGVECFVGGRQDPVFGPIVIAGLGGIFLEIFKDTAIRLAPVTKDVALDMLRQLKAYPVLQGARGKMPADMDALADIICRVSHLLAQVPYIGEIDLNPLIVHETGKGVSAVDCRVFFK